MLSQDFKEFIQSLNANGVRYLVIGGYALAAHGHPRYTKDLDIWLELSKINALRILNAIDGFGFGALGLTQADFMNPDQVIQLGYPPCRIDLLTSADGVEFASCYAKRMSLDIEGLQINFIDLEGLRANKLASGRAQDLADLEALE